jgi:PAS domain S-box-containing protein
MNISNLKNRTFWLKAVSTVVLVLTLGLWVAALAWALGGPAPVVEEPEPDDSLKANVLYLNSYHYGYSWSDEILKGIKKSLEPHRRVELQVEYMDFKKYELAHTGPLLVDLYLRKFSGKQFDLIIVSDNNAFEFMREYGELLFPDVPVIFCGVNDFDPSTIDPERMTGVVENFDPAQTLEVAMKLHPYKERLVVIGDTSITGLAIMNQIKAAESRFEGRLEFHYWTKYDLDEIISRVARASSDTFFYFIPFYTEINNRFYSAQELLSLVTANSAAPTYSSWEFLLGHGIVGGALLSGFDHGTTAAQMALRILKGVPVAQVPVVTAVDTVYRFDYNVLRRQRILMDNLPPGSILINEPKAFYELDKEIFWTIMVSMFLLLMVTMMLVRNIVRRRAIEIKMQDQLSFQEILMDTIPHLVNWKDRQQDYLGANRYFMEFFGVSEEDIRNETSTDERLLRYREFAEWANHRDREVVRTERAMQRVRRSVTNAQGETRLLEIRKVPLRDKSGNVVGSLSTGEDITREANLETQLIQSQKMEAIGTLAGGIAHDFNNILTSIINSTELALMDVAADSPAGNDLERSLKAAQRGSSLVKQILTFSRPSKEGFQPTKVQDVVHEAVALLKASLPRNIRVTKQINDDIPSVQADPTQINQIVMNLGTNAYQAMRDVGGRIEIALDKIALDQGSAEVRNVAPGNYLKLTVQDNGPGVSPEIVDKIFDPFFTTKGKAEGTGLGLAVVLGIIKAHRGSIELESSPRERTAFSVLLPMTPESTRVDPVEAYLHKEGSGHILFVEDDVDQLETIPRVLASLGYTVTPASNAAEAMEAIAGDPDGFDLVLTDYDMPEKTGLELSSDLMDVAPWIPVIMVSGRERALSLAGAQENIAKIMAKPYDRSMLSEAIREVLESDDKSN